jgi:hypothetical protein
MKIPEPVSEDDIARLRGSLAGFDDAVREVANSLKDALNGASANFTEQWRPVAELIQRTQAVPIMPESEFALSPRIMEMLARPIPAARVEAVRRRPVRVLACFRCRSAILPVRLAASHHLLTVSKERIVDD